MTYDITVTYLGRSFHTDAIEQISTQRIMGSPEPAEELESGTLMVHLKDGGCALFAKGIWRDVLSEASE